MQAALEFYKTVVQHIAQPTFAGFKNNLCTDNFLYVLKRIAPEKVPILLDEYALEVCLVFTSESTPSSAKFIPNSV